MKLPERARIIVEVDLSRQRAGYSTEGIGYLMQRLLTGQEADMTNLANLGITVREVSEDQDEFIAIKREVME